MVKQKSPIQYKNELADLNVRYKIALDSITNSFPYSKAYPNSDSSKNEYNKDEETFNELRADLFLFRDSLQQDIDKTADGVSGKLKKINVLEKDNAKIMKILNSLENKKLGAVGMFNDSKEIYNMRLSENWLYFLSILGISYSIYAHSKTNY